MSKMALLESSKVGAILSELLRVTIDKGPGHEVANLMFAVSLISMKKKKKKMRERKEEKKRKRKRKGQERKGKQERVYPSPPSHLYISSLSSLLSLVSLARLFLFMDSSL